VVALPVLEFSPLLTDEDLLEIIEGGCLPDRLEAIARRYGVGETVSDAVVARDEASAITALLQNDSAQIREETLDNLVERAQGVPSWQEPLVRRPRLPARVVQRLAGFVSERLLEVLRARSDLDDETARAVADEVERRLSEQADAGVSPGEGREPPEKLDENGIEQAVARGERRTVAQALAARSGMPQEAVERILAARSARGVTAIAWKAGLSMRLATQLQMRLGGIPPQQVLHPRGGTDYPLSEDEMSWQLEFFESLDG
jgi:uncharacterized protein (DUF2336 family)